MLKLTKLISKLIVHLENPTGNASVVYQFFHIYMRTLKNNSYFLVK